MSLLLVATPIGNYQDISSRAIEALKSADLIIGEEPKPLRKLLKYLGLPLTKEMAFLNEHSQDIEVQQLAIVCQTQRVCLVSDCGTPGFADPGPRLTQICRQMGIPVSTVPGPSSLSCLLSLGSRPITHFEFLGFPPREANARSSFFEGLKAKMRQNLVLMDTPYRLEKTLKELNATIPHRRMLLGTKLTERDELVLEDQISKLANSNLGKRNFIALIYAESS